MSKTETLPPAEPVSAELVPAKKRLCDISVVLGGTIGTLIQQQPENPVIRAQALALIHQEIPKELVNYDDIKEWVETTIEPKKVEASKPVPVANEQAIRIEVICTDTASGTCSYSEERRGSGDMEISVRELRDRIAESENFDELVDNVAAFIKENARSWVDMGTVGDVNYDSYEGDSCDDESTSFNTRILREGLLEWMEGNDMESLENWGDA